MPSAETATESVHPPLIFTGAGTSRRSVQPSDKVTPAIGAPTGAFQGSTAAGLSLFFEQPVKPVTSNMTSAEWNNIRPRTASGIVFTYHSIFFQTTPRCADLNCHDRRELLYAHQSFLRLSRPIFEQVSGLAIEILADGFQGRETHALHLAALQQRKIHLGDPHVLGQVC